MRLPRRTDLRISEILMNVSASHRSLMGLGTFCFDETIIKNISGTNVSTISIVINPQILRLKTTFRIIMVSISVIGVVGNVLNLLTLKSPSLRTVPFRYIRALAIYDLISLTVILVHFFLEILRFDSDPFIYYKVWVEDVLINSFLVAGLYVAVFLTIERYLLIRKPYKKSRLLSIENTVTLKIGLALFASILLHLPMSLQNRVKRDPTTGQLVKGNNQQLLCREPYWTIFTYYKMFREFLRFFCVVILMSLNITIAKNLQIAKKNRRMLIKRSSQIDCTNQELILCNASMSNFSPLNNTSFNIPPIKEKTNKRDLNILKSFTEKKLTVLMGAICLIYVIGNVPQMVVMVVQNESLNDMFSFQVFRNVANTLEVLNHCLNFFIFCMASSEYTRAFLLNNCGFFRRYLFAIPCIANFINARRTNSLFDQYYLQLTISDGCERNYFKTDCVVNAGKLRKQSVATMSPSSNNSHVDLVRRKSASMCLPVPPTLKELGIKWVQGNNLAPPASSFIAKQENDNLFISKSATILAQQQRSLIYLSLLDDDKVSIQSATYRDNMLPNRRESIINPALTINESKKASVSSKESSNDKSSKSSYYEKDSSSEKCIIVIDSASILIQEDDDFL